MLRIRHSAAGGVFFIIISSIPLFQRRHGINDLITQTEPINSETVGVSHIEDTVAPIFSGTFTESNKLFANASEFEDNNNAHLIENEGTAEPESFFFHQADSTTKNGHVLLGSNGSWKIEFNNNTLSCTIGSKTSEETAKSIERKANGTSSLGTNNKFVIHVHGLQHTGTGYLRKVIYDGLGSGSNASMQHSSVYEDEGQHMQTVYPRGHNRMKAWKKSKSRNISQYMYLPDLCEVYNPFETGKELMQQWSEYWNMSQYYLIQKTPFMDVEFLERIKFFPTFHAIIMRHPLVFSKFLASHGVNNPVDYLLIWLDSWAHTLGILSTGNVDMYAVVTYESLLTFHDSISNELTAMIRNSTISNSRKLNSDNRRLDLHEGNNPSKYLEPNEATILLWKKCLRKKICKDLLQEMNRYIFPHIGYGLEDDVKPHAIQMKENFGRVLFSPSVPPPAELWNMMRILSEKYSFVGS